MAISKTKTGRVPARLRSELREVLITRSQIARRVRELAVEIQHDFQTGDLVIVSLLNGTVMFLGDLIRQLQMPLRLDFMGVSSYGKGTKSGELVFTKELRLDVKGRDVLVVDDILDTGKTLHRVIAKLKELQPKQVRVCVLLRKKVPREFEIKTDYAGFEIPNEFVVGYGLDYAEQYRNLPFIGILNESVYRK